MPLRLIDLHCNWLRQYAGETRLYGSSCLDEVPGLLGRLDGYMSGTSAAVLVSGRGAEDWARRDDRWRLLDELIVRYESEFAGRLLIGPDDVKRWRAEPSDGLCWGMLGVAGFDSLIRKPADLDRLPGLFERGVRVFQPVENGSSLLAGSADPGDDRGLTELGRSFLSRLAELAGGGEPSTRPIVDLAHLNARSMAEVIKLGTEGAFAGRLLMMYSHGALVHEGFATPRALDHDNLIALRAGGGVIGLTAGRPYHLTPAELRAGIEAAASVPFEGRVGYEGIALGCDFLGVEQTLPRLGNVSQVKKWITRRFDRETAVMLIAVNGRRLLVRAAGGDDVPVGPAP
ncbi:MAG: membrane dipeptidase [Isosphaerales bacterium]